MQIETNTQLFLLTIKNKECIHNERKTMYK